jgi:hypothetical protein
MLNIDCNSYSMNIDANAITNETKNILIEAKSSLVILILTILIISILCMFLSIWLVKTITHNPAPFISMISQYFELDDNQTEPIVTWWTPIHIQDVTSAIQTSTVDLSHSIVNTSKSIVLSYNNDEQFHTMILLSLFATSILLAVLAYYARMKCTRRSLAWGAVPKPPTACVNALTMFDPFLQHKQAQPDLDYTIVRGKQGETVMFALSETLQTLNENEHQPRTRIHEITSYDIHERSK